jgi:hypothetical protein
MAIARNRERQFLGLAPDDAAKCVACDAPASIAVDVVPGPEADARSSSDRHSALRARYRLIPLYIFRRSPWLPHVGGE